MITLYLIAPVTIASWKLVCFKINIYELIFFNKKMESVYFIERLNTAFGYHDEKASHVEMILFDASKYNYTEPIEEQDLFQIQVVSRDKVDKLFEGHFVFIQKENDNIKFLNANSSVIAKRHIYINNRVRGSLIKKNLIDKLPDIGSANKVTSYHINVGHGNCSFIVSEKGSDIEVIVIDCANYDLRKRQSYQQNIDKCICLIKKKYRINKFKINYAIITHCHYDHYSGFCNLINNGYIDGSTIFFLNTFYGMASPSYSNLLIRIIQSNAKVIEPIASNSSNSIVIRHPVSRTVKSARSRYLAPNVIVEPYPNNSSVVSQICISQKSFLFPGDAETDAWNRIINCAPHLNSCDYLAISHHGSINGHNRSCCPAGCFNNNPTIANCYYRRPPILMGRTGAFRGIPSPQVINDFGRVVYSEHDYNNKPTSCVELDWSTNSLRWHY